MGKYRFAIVVFISVTALALLNFVVSYAQRSSSDQAGVEPAAISPWFILFAGLAVAIALAGYLIQATRTRLIEQQLSNDRAEIRNLIVSARKLEAMAQLVGSVAHDFNNVLMTVSGYAALALAKSEEADDPEMREYLSLISLSAEHGTTLMGKLLSISRGKSQRRENGMDLLPAVHNTLDLLTRMLPEDIAVQIDIAENLPALNVDALVLEQIVTNLVMNAKEAISDKGTICISLKPVALTAKRCNACQQTFAGNFVCLSVSDTGRGITLENMGEIFQPFYTTKNAGNGAGLGLALLHNLVHGAGGHVELTSAPGQGTAVSIFFPANAATGGRARPAQSEKA